MSQRHPGSRRAHRESQSNADDAFVARILEFSRWASSNQQVLTVAAVIAVLVVAGALYYRSYRTQLHEQAAEQLETVHQSIAINDTEGAKADLATFLDRFGGTPYEGEARLVLGELYLNDREPQQALAVLEPLGSSPREPIEFQGAALLAAAYEQEGRTDEAEQTYMAIADRSELDFQVRNALAAAARIRLDRGDTQGAIQLYERVLGSLEENSPQRGLYEMRIQEIRSATNS